MPEEEFSEGRQSTGLNFLEIPGDVYFDSLPKFVDFLIKEKDLESIIKGDNFSVIGGITQFENLLELEDSVSKRFKIQERYGDLLLIANKKEDVSHYLFFDRKNHLIIFFTLARKTKAPEIPAIADYLDLEKRTSRLYFSPTQLSDIKQKIIRKYPYTTITYFSTRRLLHYQTPSLRRPNIKRTIQYNGDDGREALDELEMEYGVLPTIIEFIIPEERTKFKIDNKGIFTFMRGNFNILFELVDEILRHILVEKKIIANSRFEVVKAKTETKEFDIPISTPWKIKLANVIDYDDIGGILDDLKSDEWEFAIVDSYKERGSLLFSAQLIDAIKGARFKIITNGKEINIYPSSKDYANLASSFKLLEFFRESWDYKAELIPLDIPEEEI